MMGRWRGVMKRRLTYSRLRLEFTGNQMNHHTRLSVEKIGIHSIDKKCGVVALGIMRRELANTATPNPLVLLPLAPSPKTQQRHSQKSNTFLIIIFHISKSEQRQLFH